jgi:hypothetical protein
MDKTGDAEENGKLGILAEEVSGAVLGPLSK